MAYSEELINKALSVSTPEELAAVAKENNIELSSEKAKVYFERIHSAGEIADDELDNVAGGSSGCDAPPSGYGHEDGVYPPKAEVKKIDGKDSCPNCSVALKYTGNWQGGKDNFDVYKCPNCGKTFRHYYIGNHWTLN